MYGYGYGWSWGGMLFMIVSTLFWIGLFALVIWAIARWLTDRRGPVIGQRHLAPREILDRRYANGEIDEETYDRMLARLEGRSPSSPVPPPAGVR